jgi:hypothetical protein
MSKHGAERGVSRHEGVPALRTNETAVTKVLQVDMPKGSEHGCNIY